MTKEELRATAKKIGTPSGNYSYVPLMALEDFLSSNVVIPKGENHPHYADIYNETAEGTPWQWSKDGTNWFDVVSPPVVYKYRIKPQEPVYEWQWYRVLNGEIVILQEGNKKFYSNIEAEERWNNLFKVESTKRIRK
jgi:hypothetical protein